MCSTPMAVLPARRSPWLDEPWKTAYVNRTYEKKQIDLVLFAGVYRTEFILEPALATLLAAELQINEAVKPSDSQNTLAFDVFNGGMSFLTAADIAAQMIRSGKINTALIVAAEIENNREVYPEDLIGLKETASAVVLDAADESRAGFGEIVYKYLPESLDARTVTGKYTSGSPRLILQQDQRIEDHFLSLIPAAVDELLSREGLTIGEIDLVLPPQFSDEFLNDLACALAITREKVVDLFSDHQDWFTSALPGCLHEIESRKLAHPGNIGLVIGVGAGLQVGCAVYYF